MGIFTKFVSLFQGPAAKKNIDEIEDLLLETGLAPGIVFSIIELLSKRISVSKDSQKIMETVEKILIPMLKEYPFELNAEGKLEVIFLVGVNGVGKTTSLAKLAYRCMKHYRLPESSLLLGAADTFRAGAIEQLSVHAKNLAVDIVRQLQGSDSSAVIYDCLEHARAKKKQLALIDTAGRMNSRNDLMQELEKNYRTIIKHVEPEQVKIFIVLDGNSGQNTITQVEDFSTILPIQASILTKYDGSSKGGTIPSITQKTGLPCAFLGTGERYEDLAVFKKESFIHEFLAI